MAHGTSNQDAEIPAGLYDLINRFHEQSDTYKSGHYNETQLRREFIDPFFKLLGWDIDNTQGYAEAYKDVIHEDAIKVGGNTKAPDYCFRVGGTRKFFVEAKKPSIDIKDHPPSAFQLRRYAWSAKLPLSILTDFEEFAVYDCRVKPTKKDSAAVARILYLHYTELPEHWEALVNVFSRDAVLKGGFDAHAETSKKKRGTLEVDDAFLSEIEGWRDILARNIALRNPSISQDELNLSVQRIIDRIIFLRICEDRGIESYGRLLSLTKDGSVYKRLIEQFQEADERFNSGLFHFRQESGQASEPDRLTVKLEVDDKPLRSILGNLYYPDSPYEFSVLPADILGQVYEQFLGKVIRLTRGHQAKVEEKPEVRKAGGVYYTPNYIVKHVTSEVLEPLLSSRDPRDIGGLTKDWRPSKAKGKTPLAILDPACGSGSFLLEAYQYLLEWYREMYVSNGPELHVRGSHPRLYQVREDEWKLTTAERKRILVAHIYGVDLDKQAVEVTKLSLLLKVLEGEDQQALKRQLKLFKERALPDLGHNIRHGNSLVGPDFIDTQPLDFFDDSVLDELAPFCWEEEFPTIMARGGFDAVIGNPPWGQKAISQERPVKTYVQERYASAKGIFDLFRPFVERGIRLTKKGGYFGMVLPDIVLLKNYEATRRYVLSNLEIARIDWWGMAFRSAVIDATTILGQRRAPKTAHKVNCKVHDADNPVEHEFAQAEFWNNPRCVFNLYLTEERQKIVKHLEQFPRLKEYFEAHEGVHSGNIRKELFVDEEVDSSCKPLLFGRGELAAYRVVWDGRFIRLSKMPAKRTKARYANLGKIEWHETAKVLVRRTGDSVVAAVDEVGRYASNNFFLVLPCKDCPLDLHGLTALLNSRFMSWYFMLVEPRKGRVFAELKIKNLSEFPLPLSGSSLKVAGELNELGRRRAQLAEGKSKSAERSSQYLDQRIERVVVSAFGVGGYDEVQHIEKQA